MHGVIRPKDYGLTFARHAAYDVITEACICKDILANFGMHYAMGSALFGTEQINTGKDEYLRLCCDEHIFRSFLKDINITNAVEIGTKNGVSAILLAHYAYHLTTIDVIPRTEPLSLWEFFGVTPKIDYTIVLNDSIKKKLVDTLDFDFAFIDGDHSYEGMKSDFELVKRCGRVLFHDYDLIDPPPGHGARKFFGEFPEGSLETKGLFAYWEK